MDLFSKFEPLEAQIFMFTMGMQVDIIKLREELDKQKREHQLTAGEFGFVIFLKENLNLQVKELAQLLGVSSPTVVSRLNNLEEKNYIERVRTKKDRRIVTIKLTDFGLEFCNSVNFSPKVALERKLSVLSVDEKSLLLELLTKLNTSFTSKEEKMGVEMMGTLLQKMLGFKYDPNLLI